MSKMREKQVSAFNEATWTDLFIILYYCQLTKNCATVHRTSKFQWKKFPNIVNNIGKIKVIII